MVGETMAYGARVDTSNLPDYITLYEQEEGNFIGDLKQLKPELANLEDPDLMCLIGYLLEPASKPDSQEIHYKLWIEGEKIAKKLNLAPCSTDVRSWNVHEYHWLVENIKASIAHKVIFTVQDGGDDDYSVDLRTQHDEDKSDHGRVDIINKETGNIEPEDSERTNYMPQSLFEPAQVDTIFEFDLRMPYPLINWLRDAEEGTQLILDFTLGQIGVEKLMEKLMKGDTLTTEELMEIQKYQMWQRKKDGKGKYDSSAAAASAAENITIPDESWVLDKLQCWTCGTNFRDAGEQKIWVITVGGGGGGRYSRKKVLMICSDCQEEAWHESDYDAIIEFEAEEVPVGAKIMNRVINSARWQRYLEQDYKLSLLQKKVKEVEQLQKELIMATLNYPNVLIL